MKESELINLVRRLGHHITEAPSKLPANKISEIWTRLNLIDPLLKALGWDNLYEVIPGDSSIHDDFIDYTLRPLPAQASSLCVEAKPLLSPPPRDRGHEEIKKGLEQTEARGSDYFIWTNGDTWQLFAVKLPNAPIYEVNIGQVGRDESKIQLTADRLRLLSRETVVNSPQSIVEQIMAYWKERALPQAFKVLSEELAEETIKLMKSVLPPELDISSEEILKFLKECRWEGIHIRQPSFSEKRRGFKPCPAEWEKLVASREPRYVKARETLLENPRRKLGEYLISNDYEPWRRTMTFSLLGLPERGSDTKAVTGPAVGRYKEYGFIETVDPQARPDEITYKRVDEAMPYLRRILQPR
jgi:hypothetical protein